VFQNGVLRRIFGPKRDEVTGEWRKRHNEELRDLYSPNIVRDVTVYVCGGEKGFGGTSSSAHFFNSYPNSPNRT
jgi:hypothetical protein